MFIGVVLALFMLSFSQGFSELTRNYFGEYLTCLFETGELPSLGLPEENSGVEGTEVCNARFESFSLTAGRPRSSGSSGSGGGGGTSGRNPRDSAERAGRNSASATDGRGGRAQAGDAAQDSRGGGGGGGRGRGSFGGSRGNDRNNPAQQRVAAKAEDGGAETPGGDLGQLSSGGDGLNNRRSNGNGERIPYRAITGSRFQDEEEGAALREDRVATTVGNGGGSNDDGPTRVLATDGPLKKKQILSNDESFDFSQYLKYIVIVAILIALLLFFGGQLQQVRKGWQKR